MLKKIVLTIAIVAFAANAFAAATAAVVSTASTWPTTITFVPSKSVVLGYESGLPTGVTSGNNSLYSIASKNKAGDKIFATTSASTAVVQAVGVTGSDLIPGDLPDLPTSTTDSTIKGGTNSNWTVM